MGDGAEGRPGPDPGAARATSAPDPLAGRVLVVDDDEAIRATMGRGLRRLGLTVELANDGLDAEAALARGAHDLCITDLDMPRADGFHVLERAMARTPRVPVVIITGQGTVAAAVRAMRSGAVNFLSKPVRMDEVAAVVRDVLGRAASASPAARPDDDPARGAITARPSGAASPAPGHEAVDCAGVFVSQDPRMRAILAVIERVADTDSTILITGESGTGKEVIARVIHSTSRRAARPLVALNCAAVPETLLESELFGHVRGAFTGAAGARQGRLALAEGGTLLLDEVADMSPLLQAKLLRVLQEREYSPVGESRTVRADVRIVAATNADLEQRVADGRFRQDLLFRLNVIQLELPPLRARPGDLRPLARHLLGVLNVRLHRGVDGFADAALDALARHAWPGNVRELENVIERAVALRGQGRIELVDLPPKLLAAAAAAAPATVDLPPEGVDLQALLADVEDRLIRQALERTKGNKNRAAALLGMNRTTLSEKLLRKKRDR